MPRGSDHYNHTDICLLDPAHAMVGDIAPGRMLAITSAYVMALFDQYLEGEKSQLLDGPSSGYPEVSTTARTAR